MKKDTEKPLYKNVSGEMLVKITGGKKKKDKHPILSGINGFFHGLI